MATQKDMKTSKILLWPPKKIWKPLKFLKWYDFLEIILTLFNVILRHSYVIQRLSILLSMMDFSKV